ncbi:basic proline-rich protein-like [Molothrus ater]|uniref:basic proline-rich protein-like n=1 Tax=Molothrus ater TaxID=84834 RepID=UPI00174C8A8B|nr:basic proline-rich protein-like [Molothrus ater]
MGDGDHSVAGCTGGGAETVPREAQGDARGRQTRHGRGPPQPSARDKAVAELACPQPVGLSRLNTTSCPQIPLPEAAPIAVGKLRQGWSLLAAPLEHMDRHLSHSSPAPCPLTCQQSSQCPRGKGKPPTLAPARPSPAPGAGNGPGPFRPPRPRAGGSCAGAPCQGTEASTPSPPTRPPPRRPGELRPPELTLPPRQHPQHPLPPDFGDAVPKGGGVQQSLETPVVSVPRPAVESGPPCTGNPSSWKGLPPAGPPPAAGVSPPLPGPSPAGQRCSPA